MSSPRAYQSPPRRLPSRAVVQACMALSGSCAAAVTAPRATRGQSRDLSRAIRASRRPPTRRAIKTSAREEDAPGGADDAALPLPASGKPAPARVGEASPMDTIGKGCARRSRYVAAGPRRPFDIRPSTSSFRGPPRPADMDMTMVEPELSTLPRIKPGSPAPAAPDAYPRSVPLRALPRVVSSEVSADSPHRIPRKYLSSSVTICVGPARPPDSR